MLVSYGFENINYEMSCHVTLKYKVVYSVRTVVYYAPTNISKLMQK